MKFLRILKYIISTVLILAGIVSLVKGESVPTSLLTLALGLLFFPSISDFLKEKVPLWNKRDIRYITYIVLFGGMAATINATNKGNKYSDFLNAKKNNKKLNLETCNFSGKNVHVIPGIISENFYTTLEEKGFEIDKRIPNEVRCTLSKEDIKYDVLVTECSSDKIISIETVITDPSGSQSEDIKLFLGSLASLSYENANPDKAKKWAEANAENNGAQTTIGHVNFAINLKSKYSRSFTIKIKE